MTNNGTEFYRPHNGEKSPLAFAGSEYESRLSGLRKIMEKAGVDAAVLISMHNIAYHSGFLYCSFGRPYALVVTSSESVPFWKGSMPAIFGADATATTSPMPTGSVTTAGEPSTQWPEKAA